MSDHTPEPWKAHPFMSPAKGNPITRWLLTHDGRERGEVYAFGPDHGKATAARIVACINACAGIPTEQLGNVADLLKAAKLGPQYMALAHSDALNDKKPELAKIAKLDYETAMAGIKPFVGLSHD